MATVRMMQTGMHVPWQEGEIVTVQVTSAVGDGEYLCETIETYAPDLKEKHAAALLALETAHQAHANDLYRQIADLTPKPAEELT